MDKIQVLVSSYNRPKALCAFLHSFVLQTVPNWTLHVVQDGPNDQVAQVVAPFLTEYPNIRYHEFPHKGYWGFFNRQNMVDRLVPEDGNWVLMTNEDNYYPPVFTKTVLDEIGNTTDIGMVCVDWTGNDEWIHYHCEPRKYFIRMGQGIARFDYAKKVRIVNPYHPESDSTLAQHYADAIRADGLRIHNINKILMVHN